MLYTNFIFKPPLREGKMGAEYRFFKKPVLALKSWKLPPKKITSVLSFSISQTTVYLIIPRLLPPLMCNLKVHYHIHKSPPIISITKA